MSISRSRDNYNSDDHRRRFRGSPNGGVRVRRKSRGKPADLDRAIVNVAALVNFYNASIIDTGTEFRRRSRN